MASKAFFDPTKVLLATPLLSTTASLLFGWDQTLFLSVFTNPECVEHDSNSMLPSYWRVFLSRGLPQVLGFLSVTVASSLASVFLHKPLLQRKGSLVWYTAAAALAVSHLVFTPKVAPLIKFIMDNEGGRPREMRLKDPQDLNVDAQEKWTRANTTRTFTTDLGAWLCAFVAVMTTFGLE